MEFIHRWIKGTSERVILALHGTGADENDLIPLVQALDPAASILSPRGRVSEGGANRFFRRFAEGVFDQENMRSETEALASFLVTAASEHGFTADRVIALGFSNGANMAASLLLRRPELLGGAILLRAMVPFEPDASVDLSGKRVFMANGTHDPLMSLENSKKLVEIFRTAGAEVEHLIVDAGHNLIQQDFVAAKAWLSGN